MKKAFTMIELVFVIVVIGILAAVMIPRTDSTTLSERAIELVSKIRYTQHLAMVDDKFDGANATWMRNRWQITFNGNQYSIVSDNDTTFAANPINDGNVIQNIELRGVTVALSGGCNGQTDISFDSLGRPMTGDISDDTAAYTSAQLLTSTCVITLNDGTDDLPIHIRPETGYASIIYP